MMRPARWLVACAALTALFGGGVVPAADQHVSSSGLVHRVRESIHTSEEQSGGTELVYTRQSPSGDDESSVIPGTDDHELDREPTLDLLPGTGEPVLVWSRNDGTGYRLHGARRDAGGWSAPVPLIDGSVDQREPSLQAGADWLHLRWREGTGGAAEYYRAVLDPRDLALVAGPERLATPSQRLVPPEGESAPSSPEPSADGLWMTGSVVDLSPVVPPKVYVWGIRDGVDPVLYCQGFELPTGTRDIRTLDARWVGDRLTLSFHDGGRFYYTMRKNGTWTDLRAVVLDEQITPTAALLQMEEMIREDAASAAP